MSTPSRIVAPTLPQDFGVCVAEPDGIHRFTPDGIHRFTDGKCRCGKTHQALVMTYTWERLKLLDYLRRLHARPRLAPETKW